MTERAIYLIIISNYIDMYMPSLYQSEGGIVLSKSTLTSVSGTIKIPKE